MQLFLDEEFENVPVSKKEASSEDAPPNKKVVMAPEAEEIDDEEGIVEVMTRQNKNILFHLFIYYTVMPCKTWEEIDAPSPQLLCLICEY